VQNHPAPAELAEKTVAYAKAKTAYFTALREEMPELINSATRRKLRPLQLDNFIATFAVAGEKQEDAADEKTLTLLERFSANPDVEKARTKFELAQKIEEAFHKDFDGIDLTSRSIGRLARIKFTNLCIGCDINKDAFESALLLRIPILQDGRLLKLAEAKR